MASALLLLVAVASSYARGAGAFTGTPGISALQFSLGSRLGLCRRLAPLVGPGEGLPGGRRRGEDGLAGTAMQIKVQNDKKRDNDGFQRWWDPAWRSLRVAELKVGFCTFHRGLSLRMTFSCCWCLCVLVCLCASEITCAPQPGLQEIPIISRGRSSTASITFPQTKADLVPLAPLVCATSCLAEP